MKSKLGCFDIGLIVALNFIVAAVVASVFLAMTTCDCDSINKD